MKVGERTVYVSYPKVDILRAGELSDVGNILTSPDLFRVVGLPARR
jgi:hypothetical protein